MTEDPLTLALAPSPDAQDTAVGYETVILHLGNDGYYGLDPIGTVVWNHLKRGDQPPTILKALTARYDAPRLRIEADLRALLQDMLANDIVVRA